MSRVLLISDNPIGVSDRGAESCDRIIFDQLKCDFATCFEFNDNPRTDYDKIIVSNFSALSDYSKEALKKTRYETYNHDFLFVGHRIPSFYENCLVPEDQKINIDFFNSAHKNYVQSSFQGEIFEKNRIKNVVNLDGNLWTADDLDDMVALNGPKNGRAAIIAGYYKGEEQSVNLARQLNIPFDILPKLPYKEFLAELSKFSLYLFNPPILESFCRVLYEAKLMGVIPVTTNMCGGVHSELWKYNGEELAGKLKDKRREIIKILRED